MWTCFCALMREECVKIGFDSLFHDMYRNLGASWRCNKPAQYRSLGSIGWRVEDTSWRVTSMIKCKAPKNARLWCTMTPPKNKTNGVPTFLCLLSLFYISWVTAIELIEIHLFATCSLFDQKLLCSLVACQYTISTPPPAVEALLIPANQIPFWWLNKILLSVGPSPRAT